jgi:hypothetical protein
MQARIPLMIQDPTTSKKYEGLPNLGLEGFNPKNEDFFLSGPVSRQIAVLDFDPDTGKLVEGAKWHKPPLQLKRGWYEDNEEDEKKRKRYDEYENLKLEDLTTPTFLQVNTFATVLKTIYMLRESEKEKDKDKGDTLGHSITWANGSPQLLVIPRAGYMKNAFYHRDSNSLQFFMFSPDDNPNQTVYTCLFRDIVSHETGHAIVDAIAPDLYHAQQSQALAMHESIADLTALLMAISSWNLNMIILKKNNGKITDSTEFSTIADNWRTELAEGGRELRNLLNSKNLNPESENCIKDEECHELCQVLSGSLYNVFLKIYEDFKGELEPYYAKDPKYSKNLWFHVSRSALYDYAAERFKQMIFRALDYLPPGDVSFVDYGRAIIAADSVGYSGEKRTQNIRDWLKDEFFERGIINDKDALDVNTFFKDDALDGFDVATFCKSDWVAYQFANTPKGRKLLCIPPDIPFEVLSPRLEVRKKPIGRPPLYDPNNIKEVHECIFKVAWDPIENNPIGWGIPEKRRFRVGTTLSLCWEDGTVLALLSSAPPDATNTDKRYSNQKQRSLIADEFEKKSENRTNFVKFLINEGLLKFNQHSLGPDGSPLLSCVQGEDLNGIMRISGSGKMLHIISR